MYNGDSFGYLKEKPVTGGPYRFFEDPQYFGTTLMCAGYALVHQSRLGYGLSGIMYITFQLSVMLFEGPHMDRVYAEQKIKGKKTKAKGEKVAKSK